MAEEQQSTFIKRNWPALVGLVISLLIVGAFFGGGIKPPTDYVEQPRTSLR